MSIIPISFVSLYTRYAFSISLPKPYGFKFVITSSTVFADNALSVTSFLCINSSALSVIVDSISSYFFFKIFPLIIFFKFLKINL